MKNIFVRRRNKSPHSNEEAEKKGTSFFGKESKTPFFNTSKGTTVQPKLTIGQPNDKYEKKADSMADAVVSESSKPNIQNKKISRIQRESLATPQEDEKLGTAEQRMEKDKLVQEKPEIQKMESEEDEIVNKMENSEEEQAVLQTKSNTDKTTASSNLTEQIEKNISPKTNYLQQKRGTSPVPTTCGKPADCGAPFCSPFPNRMAAIIARTHLAPVLLAGISGAVSPRVVPLWSRYLFGGSGPLNISSSFGSDFTRSPTTISTTSFLVNAIKTNLRASPPTFPSGLNTIVLNIASIIPVEIAAINTPGDFNEMNFNVIGDIPGNIAGGIGTTQLSCPVGARPSPFNDERLAKGKVIVTKLPDGSLLAQPFISYKVKDTIDLCPGNCGALKEKIATIPMSMMEASGISGDVPLIVDFNAMPIAPFFIRPPVSPSFGEITASALRIRSAPNLSAPILDKYPRGTTVRLECQTTGSFVRGNNAWYKTDRGFISGEYVRLTGNTPTSC